MRSFIRLLVWLIAALAPTLCSAQSFIFVSPNTREHLSDEDALVSLDSFEQRNFMAVADYLGKRICAHPKTQPSEGLDGSGAENSAMITGCAPQPALYLAELLARYAHQKSVLIFAPAAKGTERLFVLNIPSQHPSEALRQLRRHGFTAATVMPENQNIRIFIWAQDHSQDQQVRALAADAHADIQELAGKGQLIGNDDRRKAQEVFDKDIAAHEGRRKVQFSTLLWSRRLHDLGLHPKG